MSTQQADKQSHDDVQQAGPSIQQKKEEVRQYFATLQNSAAYLTNKDFFEAVNRWWRLFSDGTTSIFMKEEYDALLEQAKSPTISNILYPSDLQQRIDKKKQTQTEQTTRSLPAVHKFDPWSLPPQVNISDLHPNGCLSSEAELARVTQFFLNNPDEAEYRRNRKVRFTHRRGSRDKSNPEYYRIYIVYYGDAEHFLGKGSFGKTKLVQKACVLPIPDKIAVKIPQEEKQAELMQYNVEVNGCKKASVYDFHSWSVQKKCCKRKRRKSIRP